MDSEKTPVMSDDNNFVKIDIGMPSANAASSQPLSPESLSFMPSDVGSVPLTSQSYASSYFGNTGAPYSLGGSVNTSRVSGFLKQKGFAWVMEVEQDDSDSNVPLLEELDIHPAEIANRIRSVLLPLPNRSEKMSFDTNSPDFWGPLACVVAYALVSALGQFRVLPCVLVVWLVGSFIIFIVARGLGAELTYSLCLGILGYSTLPLALVAVALPAFMPAALVTTEAEISVTEHFSPVAFFLKGVAMFWSTVSAMAAFAAFIAAGGLSNRRPLFAYPIFLFYGYLIALYSGA